MRWFFVSKNLPKYLNTLKGWIDEFVDKLVKVANQLFKGFEAVLELLFDLGVVIVQKLDPKTGKVLVQGADGVIYVIKQADKTIFEGSKTAIEGFLNKIDDISKSGGNTTQKTKKYLKELSENFNLRIKRNSKSISLIDENGAIVFKAVDDLDLNKYFKYISKNVEERRTLIKSMKERLKSSDKVYKQENALAKGYDIPTSKNGTSPDFDGLTDYLYKGNLNFGKVKIKVTGSRDRDFALANKLMKLKETPKGYTWHHLDDLDETLGCTMQLVKTKVHLKTYNHIGSAKQLQELLNIKDYL